MTAVYCPICSGQWFYLAENPIHSGEIAQQYATYSTLYSGVALGCLTCQHEWVQFADRIEPFRRSPYSEQYWRQG